MSNTKDTPMDYKCADCGNRINEGEFKTFGVCDLCFDKVVSQKLWGTRSTIPTKEVPLEQTAQALRDKFREKNKECESLKLELQKQKELKAELVNALKVITKERSFRGGFPHTTNVFESLIKKSSEI